MMCHKFVEAVLGKEMMQYITFFSLDCSNLHQTQNTTMSFQ